MNNGARYLALPPAVDGERRETTGRSGRLSYYVAGAGAPLLLIHSINAGGSVYEVRPLFQHYRSKRRVYAVNLPGFGFSERSDRRYDVRLFVDAVHDLTEAIAADASAVPVYALALSLSSEFLARAALEQPQRFRSLTLVTPTGFGRAANALRGPPGTSRAVSGLHTLLTVPLWKRARYGLLVRKSVIRCFLEGTWGSKQIDEQKVEYDHLTTHQPGAENAPYAFLCGRLFSKDIRSVYERLGLPVWLPHGTRGDFRDFSGTDWTRSPANWTVQAFDTGALVYFEQPEAFIAACDAHFLQGGARA